MMARAKRSVVSGIARLFGLLYRSRKIARYTTRLGRVAKTAAGKTARGLQHVRQFGHGVHKGASQVLTRFKASATGTKALASFKKAKTPWLKGRALWKGIKGKAVALIGPFLVEQIIKVGTDYARGKFVKVLEGKLGLTQEQIERVVNLVEGKNHMIVTGKRSY